MSTPPTPTGSVLEHVEALHRAGLVAIPVCRPMKKGLCSATWHDRPCTRAGKRPLIEGYAEFAASEPESWAVRKVFYDHPMSNVAIVTGMGIVVVEADSQAAEDEVIALVGPVLEAAPTRERNLPRRRGDGPRTSTRGAPSRPRLRRCHRHQRAPCAPRKGTTMSPKLAWYEFEEFEAMAHAQPRGWLWKDILPATGTVMLVGAPYVGKTRIIALLSAVMQTGGELAGRMASRGLMVLAAAEHRPSDLCAVIRAAARGVDRKPDAIIVRALDLDDDERLAELAVLADGVGAKVIVIDPIRRVTTIDESRSDDVAGLHRQLAKLGPDKRLIIIVHHVGRGGGVRGSTDWEAGVDTVVYVTRAGNAVALRAVHHGAPETRLRLIIKHDGDTMTAEEEAKGAERLDDNTQAVHDVLPPHPPGLTVRGIRDALRKRKVGVRHDQVDAALAKLAAQGLAKNEGTKARHAWVAMVPPETAGLS